jgi:hypothetical protein
MLWGPREFGAMVTVNDARAYRRQLWRGRPCGNFVRMAGDGPKRLLVVLAIALVTGSSSPALAAEHPDKRWGISIWGLSYHIDHEIDFDEANLGFGLRYYFNHLVFVEADCRLPSESTDRARILQSGTRSGRDAGLRAGEDKRDHRSQAVTPAGRRHRGVAHNPIAVKPSVADGTCGPSETTAIYRSACVKFFARSTISLRFLTTL